MQPGASPKAVSPFPLFLPTFSEMGKRKKTSTVEPAPSRSKTSSPAKGGGSSPKQNLTKEDQARVIAELLRKLDATSKPKGKRRDQRSAIGAADSTTDEDDPAEASEKAADDAEPASRSKSGSTSEKYSKIGNRASKARKLFKDKDEEVEFRAWKASKAEAVEAVPVQPPGPVQSDEAPHREVQAKVSPAVVPTFYALAQRHRRGHGRRGAQGHREDVQREVQR